jgi:lipoprotein-releasing system permease protein
MYKLFLAWRYLVSRKIIYFSIAGIMVGVIALIVITSVMGGFSREIRERIRGTSSHLTIISRSNFFISDYSAIIERIKQVPHVVACAPRLEWLALLNQENAYVQLIGIELPVENKVTNFEKYLMDDKTPDFLLDGQTPDLPGMVVGKNVFPYYPIENLKGKHVSLISARLGTANPLPVEQTFTVLGRFGSGMYEYDKTNVYVSLKDAQKFLGVKNSATKICIALDDYQNAPVVIEQIKQILYEYPSALTVFTWEDEKQTFLRAVAIEKNINAVILFFIIIVAGFNIVALMTIRVAEKTLDIGIIKALGATRRGIMSLFLYQGLLIAMLGCILGIIVGLLISFNLNTIADIIYNLSGFKVFPSDVYVLDKIPSEVNWLTIFFITLATLLTSIVFSLYPAAKAGSLSPLEALRHE